MAAGWLRNAVRMGAIAAIAVFVLWVFTAFGMRCIRRTRCRRLRADGPAVPDEGADHFCAQYHLLPESYLTVRWPCSGGDRYADLHLWEGGAHGQGSTFRRCSLKWSAALGPLVLNYAFASGKVRRPREVFSDAACGVLSCGVDPFAVEHRCTACAAAVSVCFCVGGAGAGWLIQQRRVWGMLSAC